MQTYKRETYLSPCVLHFSELKGFLRAIEAANQSAPPRKYSSSLYATLRSSTIYVKREASESSDLDLTPYADQYRRFREVSLQTSSWNRGENLSIADYHSIRGNFSYGSAALIVEGSDEAWVIGTSTTIVRSFTEKGKWYRVYKAAALVVPNFFTGLVFFNLMAYWGSHHLRNLIVGIILIPLIFFAFPPLHNKIAPYIRFTDTSDDKHISYEQGTFIVTVLALLVPVGALIEPLFLKHRK